MYQVTTLESSAECLEYLQTNSPDLILLDILMPAPNGLEVCKLIKSNNHLEQIPVVFVSANAFPSDIKNAKNCGADDYLVKPFSEEEIIEVVQRYI
jgi:CheY-like chemotaxis protein